MVQPLCLHLQAPTSLGCFVSQTLPTLPWSLIQSLDPMFFSKIPCPFSVSGPILVGDSSNNRKPFASIWMVWQASKCLHRIIPFDLHNSPTGDRTSCQVPRGNVISQDHNLEAYSMSRKECRLWGQVVLDLFHLSGLWLWVYCRAFLSPSLPISEMGAGCLLCYMTIAAYSEGKARISCSSPSLDIAA